MEELRSFCSDCGLFADSFQEREVSLSFNFSIMLQIDEVYQERHLQMSFLEFIEAFARIAEKVSLIPYKSKVSIGVEVMLIMMR